MTVGHLILGGGRAGTILNREGRERLRQRDEEWPVGVRTAVAFAGLCQRMNICDIPDEPTAEFEDAWTYQLPPDQRAAYNALRGTNYGPDPRQWFTSDHPIVTYFQRYMKFRL